MSLRDARVPLVWRCGSYTPGHDVHFIQVKLSSEDGLGEHCHVDCVEDDGTIILGGRRRLWNHDPSRLRRVLGAGGADHVYLGSRSLLRVGSSHSSYYCFSVSDAPDPCRPETAEERRAESIVEELLRRGGAMRSGPQVLDGPELLAGQQTSNRRIWGGFGSPRDSRFD